MEAGRWNRRLLLLILSAGMSTAAGCSGRNPVGDASIEPRPPYQGGWYDECSAFECARSCPSDAGTVRGECVWGAEGMVCRCVGRAPEPCAAEACSASCASLGYDGSLCDPVGCRCYHAGPGDADAGADAEAEDTDVVEAEDETDAGAEEAAADVEEAVGDAEEVDAEESGDVIVAD